jgi:hypothetical protein
MIVAGATPMSRANPSQIERVRRLLAYEGAAGCATAAGRVHEKISARLTPLLGSAGVHALFVRSAKLVGGELTARAETPILQSSSQLTEFLRGLDPSVATRTAEALLGNFLALITSFIGQRLTNEALRKEWPTIDDQGPPESQE